MTSPTSPVPKDSIFYLIGATRGPEDEALVEDLRKYAREIGVENSIDFKLNKPRGEIIEIFSKAKCAIHTMKDEHFGISVVEMMAAGLVTIAHDSAGPRYDIIGRSLDVNNKQVGFLADTEEQYAKCVREAMSEYDTEKFKKMRTAAADWVHSCFSVQTFDKKFVKMVDRVMSA